MRRTVVLRAALVVALAASAVGLVAIGGEHNQNSGTVAERLRDGLNWAVDAPTTQPTSGPEVGRKLIVDAVAADLCRRAAGLLLQFVVPVSPTTTAN